MRIFAMSNIHSCEKALVSRIKQIEAIGFIRGCTATDLRSRQLPMCPLAK